MCEKKAIQKCELAHFWLRTSSNSTFSNSQHNKMKITCRGKKRRRLILIVSIYILILFFALNSYLLKLDHDSFRELIRSLRIIARAANRPANSTKIAHDDANRSAIIVNKCTRPLPVFESGQWIVNPRVAQYSAYLTLKDQEDQDFSFIDSGHSNDAEQTGEGGHARRRRRRQRLRIVLETLVLFDYPFFNERYILSRAKMVVRLADDEFVLLDIEDVFRRHIFSSGDNSMSYMWKLTTSLSLADLPAGCCHNSSATAAALEKIAIATIDIDENQTLIWSQPRGGIRTSHQKPDNDYNFENAKNDDADVNDDQDELDVGNLHSLVVFHKPTMLVVESPRPAKKKAVAHCVHMLRNLDNVRLSKLFDWLRLQESVGYDKIRFYAYRVDAHVRERIRHFLPHMVEIVAHDIEFESVCRYQISLIENGCSSPTRQLLYNSCKSVYHSFFHLTPKSQDAILNSLEFLCTSDCFKRFKESHELITNYDMDEFIFPRQTRANNFSLYDPSKLAECNPPVALFPPVNTYRSYDYFMRLFREQSTGSDDKIAAIKFENSMVLTSLNETFFDHLFSVNVRWLNLAYKNSSVRLHVERRDEMLINAIFNAQHIVQCLRHSIELDSARSSGVGFNSKWNSPYSMFVANGREKSVFNTNFTEMVNQHETDLIALGSRAVDLGMEFGFSSHFRDDLTEWFAGQTYSFSFFQMDLEYYFFLANFLKK